MSKKIKRTTVIPTAKECEFALGRMAKKPLTSWISEHPDSWIEIDTKTDMPKFIHGDNIELPILGDEYHAIFADLETAVNVPAMLTTLFAKCVNDTISARAFFNTRDGDFYFSTNADLHTVAELAGFIGRNYSKLSS